MWISKFNTKVKQKDGSYRDIKKGEPLPEASTYQRPTVWAEWIEDVKVENSKGKKTKEAKKTKKRKKVSKK